MDRPKFESMRAEIHWITQQPTPIAGVRGWNARQVFADMKKGDRSNAAYEHVRVTLTQMVESGMLVRYELTTAERALLPDLHIKVSYGPGLFASKAKHEYMPRRPEKIKGHMQMAREARALEKAEQAG